MKTTNQGPTGGEPPCAPAGGTATGGSDVTNAVLDLIDLRRHAGGQLEEWDGATVLNDAVNCKSRRWQDGERNALRQAANAGEFVMRRKG